MKLCTQQANSDVSDLTAAKHSNRKTTMQQEIQNTDAFLDLQLFRENK